MTNTSPVSPEMVRDAVNRSKRYWNEDGIPEMAIGGFWLLWGIIVLIPIAIPPLAKFRSFISIMGVLAAPAFMDFAVRRWKERVTFPRGGYVQFRPPSGTMRLTLVIMAALLAIGVVLMVRFGGHHALPDWLGVGVGFLISLTLLQLAWRMKSMRLALMCWVVLAAGIAVTLTQVPHESQMIYVFLAAGVVCVTDGGLRLREYQRQHPLPAEDQQ